MNTSDASHFRRIGAGFGGSVWAPYEDSFALKREDGGPGRSLWNDYQMHQHVLESLHKSSNSASATSAPLDLQLQDSYIPDLASLESRLSATSTDLAPLDSQSQDSTNTKSILPPRIQVPKCYRFIEAADHEWWNDKLRHFPPGYSPCNALHSERIPPLPQVVRERLIAKYCPAPLVAEIKTSDANQDCIVRPYLGRHRHGGEKASRFKAFSLRNFPLHVDQMEQLDLDVGTYAEIMAEALAMMHWHGKIDANDVEFVLAPPRSTAASATATIHSNVLGEHAMWLLDFDCCRQMLMDEKEADQAVAAFFKNDPFYPRPSTRGSRDQALWDVFCKKYRELRHPRCR